MWIALASFRRRKAKNDLADATVPTGKSLPLLRNLLEEVFFYAAAASLLDQMKSVLSRHMRCRITASFRATAIFCGATIKLRG